MTMLNTAIAFDGVSHAYDDELQGAIYHADGSMTFRDLTEEERIAKQLKMCAVMDAADPAASSAATDRLNNVLDQLSALGADMASVKAMVANGTLKPAAAISTLCKSLGIEMPDNDPLSALEAMATALTRQRSDSVGKVGMDSVSKYLRGDGDVKPAVAMDSVSRYLAGMKPDYSRMNSVERYLAEMNE
jgi:hypothetical protein